MRRRMAYGALGIVLPAVAVGLWAWRGDGSTVVHPDLNQPAVNATAQADLRALAQGLAAASGLPAAGDPGP